MEDVLYTVAEVATLFKCNIGRVHSLRKAGLLPFLKLGSYKCRRTAVLKFLEQYEGFDISDPEHIVPLVEWQASQNNQ